MTTDLHLGTLSQSPKGSAALPPPPPLPDAKFTVTVHSNGASLWMDDGIQGDRYVTALSGCGKYSAHEVGLILDRALKRLAPAPVPAVTTDDFGYTGM